MKINQKLAAIIAILGACPLQADDRSFGDGTLPEFLIPFDVNEDGQVDEEERQAIRDARKAAREQRRAEIDTDDDGEISEEEREAARNEIRSNISERRANKFAEIAGEDGLLSLEELSQVRYLSKASENRIASLFARLDADGSGEISLEEFTARLRDHGSPKERGRKDGDSKDSNYKGKDDEDDDDDDDDEEEEQDDEDE
ncbi:MAG: EF-hand domain-containing protein [Akkermansiaceae bacterium]